MDLHELFYRWMSEYADVLKSVKAKQDYKNPFRDLIAKDIPEKLSRLADITQPYIAVGSYGKGRWTDVPWIAVFDSRITKSAQKGVYIVYLLNKETKELYLTLEIAATEVMEPQTGSDGKTVFTGIVGKNNPDFIRKLATKAEQIRSHLQDKYFSSDDKINSGASGYDNGTVYYKKYTLRELPSEEILTKDLKKMMVLYGQYYDHLYLSEGKAEVKSDRNTGGDDRLSTKDILGQIKAYISAEGFSYEEGLIENFYLSLKSKPFVILAGTSGTGKTRLVKLFAKAVGATTENGHFKMVSVRPDWSDSTDLFGHVDLNGKFVPGAIIDFIKRAEVDNEHPYFLCLDEMNLARVEYYLSDILSIIETRDYKNGSIVSDPLISADYYGTDLAASGKYGTVRLPENLYLIGTVNMDETTFSFSRKVLDRANTIEFSFVDLTPNFGDEFADQISPLCLDNSFLKTEYLLLKQCVNEADAVEGYCSELQQINRILQKAGAHVGYRVRDEIVFYLLNNKSFNLLPDNEAMDNEMMQKILPRIQGSSLSVKNMLCELFKHCAGDYDGYQTQSDDVSSKMIKTLSTESVKYRKSAEKIAFMVRRFEEDGFTSYWL